ncbi:MAG: arsenate reductase (azurin) small subunit [Acidimicrobiales bacterium]
MTRRELLLAGVATGAVTAGGVLVPVAVVLDDGGSAPGTTAPGVSVTGATGALVSVFPRTRVTSFADLEVGEPVFFDYPLVGQSNIAVRFGEALPGGVGPDRDLVAYSNICTHMGCTITDFVTEHGVLGPCPCHFTTFDLRRDGQVTLGQATQNLPRVLLDVDGDEVCADAVFRLVYGHADTLSGVGVEIAS